MVRFGIVSGGFFFFFSSDRSRIPNPFDIFHRTLRVMSPNLVEIWPDPSSICYTSLHSTRLRFTRLRSTRSSRALGARDSLVPLRPVPFRFVPQNSSGSVQTLPVRSQTLRVRLKSLPVRSSCDRSDEQKKKKHPRPPQPEPEPEKKPTRSNPTRKPENNPK